MKCCALLLSLSLLPLLSFQEIVQVNIEAKCDFFSTDKLGNAYLIAGDGLKMFNSKGKLIYQYSDKNLGNIGSLDANNALKLVLFYRDLSMIAILDNTLSVQGKAFSLSEKGFDQVTLACRSQRENLWLYDQENMELLQTDMNLNILARSGNLAQILAKTVNPTYITEQNNRLYMANPQSGIFVFDNFGTYLKTIPIKVDRFQVTGDLLLYELDGKQKKYDMIRFTEEEIKVPPGEFSRVRLEDKKVYLQHAAGVNIYSDF